MSSTEGGQGGEGDESNGLSTPTITTETVFESIPGQGISESVILKEKCQKLEQLLGLNQRKGRKTPYNCSRAR